MGSGEIIPICRGAPHLVIAHIPTGNPFATVDAFIALTHFDITAPAFGICNLLGRIGLMAATTYEPLQRALTLPTGRTFAYSLMFGHPQYNKVYGIPRRNPVQVTWK